ncbi:hypothetical protein PCE1_004034 [Barthelona sp. PCE]
MGKGPKQFGVAMSDIVFWGEDVYDEEVIVSKIENHKGDELGARTLQAFQISHKIIEEKGLEHSPVAYVASLFSGLKDPKVGTSEASGILNCLLKFLPFIGQNILEQRFRVWSSLLTAIFAYDLEETGPKPIQLALECLQYLLMSVVHIMTDSECHSVLRNVMDHCLHPDERIRKAVCETVQRIACFCWAHLRGVEKMNAVMSKFIIDLDAEMKRSPAICVQVLLLVKDVMPFLSYSSLANTKNLLNFLDFCLDDVALASTRVVHTVAEVFDEFFSLLNKGIQYFGIKEDMEGYSIEAIHMTYDKALNLTQKSLSSQKSLASYLSACGFAMKSFIAFLKIDEELDIISIDYVLLQVQHMLVLVGKCLNHLDSWGHRVVCKRWRWFLLNNEFPQLEAEITSQIEEFFRRTLTMRFQKVWDTVFGILGISFSVFPVESLKYDEILTNLEDIRLNFFSEEMPKDLQVLFKNIMCAVGFKTFFTLLPVDFVQDDSPKIFIFDIIKMGVDNPNLSDFFDFLYPLALQCLRLSKTDSAALAQYYELMTMTIWGLLPKFCDNPDDFVSTFPEVAPKFGKMMGFSPIGINVIRSLIIIYESIDKTNDDVREVASKVATRYLRSLLSLISKEKTLAKHQRLCIEGMEAILPFVAEEDVVTYFGKIKEKIDEAEGERTIVMYTDVLVVFAAYIPDATELLEFSSTLLSEKSNKLRSKALTLTATCVHQFGTGVLDTIRDAFDGDGALAMDVVPNAILKDYLDLVIAVYSTEASEDMKTLLRHHGLVALKSKTARVRKRGAQVLVLYIQAKLEEEDATLADIISQTTDYIIDSTDHMALSTIFHFYRLVLTEADMQSMMDGDIINKMLEYIFSNLESDFSELSFTMNQALMKLIFELMKARFFNLIDKKYLSDIVLFCIVYPKKEEVRVIMERLLKRRTEETLAIVAELFPARNAGQTARGSIAPNSTEAQWVKNILKDLRRRKRKAKERKEAWKKKREEMKERANGEEKFHRVDEDGSISDLLASVTKTDISDFSDDEDFDEIDGKMILEKGVAESISKEEMENIEDMEDVDGVAVKHKKKNFSAPPKKFQKVRSREVLASKISGYESGARYRSKKAGGDVERKGETAMAYIPMAVSTLNKRNSHKMRGYERFFNKNKKKNKSPSRSRKRRQ